MAKIKAEKAVEEVILQSLSDEDAESMNQATVTGGLNFSPSIDEREYRRSIETLKRETQKRLDALEELARQKQTFKLELTDRQLTSKKTVRHHMFDTVALILRNRIPAFLSGPSGSGKSKIAEQVAELLQIPYYAISVSYQTSVGTLLGYMDARGKYVRSLLREAYENGGVFCVDEIDAGNQNVMMCLNAVTNQDVVGFPDGMIKKHKDFVIVATANTRGDGADLQYAGRERIDAALLARFVQVEIDYDPDLERALIEKSKYVDEILDFVQNQRKKTTLDSNRLWTPRQTIFIAKLAEDVGLDCALRVFRH